MLATTRTDYLSWLLAFLVVAVFLPPGAGSVSPDTPQSEHINGPLDGMSFEGIFRALDGSSESNDTIHFQKGRFWSGICIVCGFRPGAYWSRRVGDTIEFQGTLESAERGRFTYQGSIADGKIRIGINWRRERWYWTVDRDYEFVGRLTNKLTSEVSLDAAWQRAAGEPLPSCPI